MLGTYAGRDVYRAITCFDTGLLAKGLSLFCDLLRKIRDTEDVFNPGSLKDIVINLK